MEAQAVLTEQGAETMEPMVGLHHFSDMFLDHPIHFIVFACTESYFLWIGSGPPVLSNLAVACRTKFVRESLPLA